MNNEFTSSVKDDEIKVCGMSEELDNNCNSSKGNGAMIACKYAYSIGHKKGIIKGAVSTLLVGALLVCARIIYSRKNK